MSAYMCSDTHIIAVAYQSLHRIGCGNDGEVDAANLQERVEVLELSNRCSLADRYGEEVGVVAGIKPSKFPDQMKISIKKDTDDEPKLMTLKAMLLDPCQMAKLVDCFEYQACDWRQWEESDALAICIEARSNILRNLSGYGTASWGTY